MEVPVIIIVPEVEINKTQIIPDILFPSVISVELIIEETE